MCNINIVSNIKGKNSDVVTNLMNTMSWLSYDENSDGEGFLKLSREGSEMGRKLEKFIFREKASTLVSHQRWATSGAKIIDYTHPFETKDLIVFHNGVLDCNEGEHSDTYIYSHSLQKNFEELKNIKEAIAETHKTISGSFSIVIYIKATKQLLYYKNAVANFYYAKFNNYLVGSTKKDNVEYACKYLKYTKKRIYTPKDHTLYDVLAGFVAISELDIKPKTYATFPTDDDDYYGYSGTRYRTNVAHKPKDIYSSYWDNRQGKWAEEPLPHQRSLADIYWTNKEKEDERKAEEEEFKEFFGIDRA